MLFRKSILNPTLIIGCLFATSMLAGGVTAQEVDFNRDIRPILSRHCISCHGPDEAHRSADLRLDIRDDALAAIEPEDPESSEMYFRITSDDEGDRMPPPDHGDALTAAEVALVKSWIEQGANYAKHWSFVVPVQKPLPALSVDNDKWARNAIDHFVAAKLASLKLNPSTDAQPARMIRRVALDLTGLPPTKEMVARYVTSPTDETYEAIVDELLAAPTYGEHWAGMWLDLARYADTIGYAEDRNRSIWPWRDWVIRAFHENKPYDEFTIEQIAGDLLPDATSDQKLATAFHRNTLNNTEGGTSDEEFRVIAVKDRISTTVNVWMGLTLRCAECHTHKYDPISHKEYYQFFDFFNQTADSDKNDERPRLEVFPDGRDVEFAKLDQKIAVVKRKIEAVKKEMAKADLIWDRLAPSKAVSRDGATMTVLDDKSIVVTGENPDFDEYKVTFDLPAGTYGGLLLEAIPSKENGGNVGRSSDGNFVLSQIRIESGAGEDRKNLKLSAATADHAQVNFPIKHVIRETLDNKGWAVGHPGEGVQVKRSGVFSFENPIEFKEPTQLSMILTFKSSFNRMTIGKFAVASTSIEKPAEKFQGKNLSPLRQELDKLVKQRNAPVRVPVMVANSSKRQSHIMTRGSYLQPAEEVSAAVMESFHPLPDPGMKNRLGVAQWLVAKKNPLTARVTVNRFWARIFGLGIVETEEDFGTQGLPPSNQELLDWLAVDFQNNGWDVKRLLKQMVTSSAYRQTSVATDDRLDIDPRNVYLSRGPRFRMRAEVIRDQALAVTGLLSHKQFGPPVYPPNPVKVVRSAFTGGTNWVESKGENRYRRAIYTYLKRTSPHPLFETFDMATREVCNMRRIRTNTPLQSFMTLNDRTFIEAAQAMAAKMYQHSDDPRKQIEFGFEMALMRKGDENQVNSVRGLYDKILKQYEADVDEAKLMVDIIDQFGIDRETRDANAAELASLTVAANVILNLDSFLTK